MAEKKYRDNLSGNFIGHIGSTEAAFTRGIREHLKEFKAQTAKGTLY